MPSFWQKWMNDQSKEPVKPGVPRFIGPKLPVAYRFFNTVDPFLSQVTLDPSRVRSGPSVDRSLFAFALALLTIAILGCMVIVHHLKKIDSKIDGMVTVAAKHLHHRKRGRTKIRTVLWIIVAFVLVAIMLLLMPLASAATSTPLKHVYNGRLLDSSGNAITTAHTIRFSYWTSADSVAGDVTGTGAINTAAGTYASWNETHTVTPDSKGYFSVQMGSSTALPTIDSMQLSTLLSLFLQVEVKASAAANTAFEILDPNTSDSTIDRSPVLSVPFSLNADKLDQKDVGTGSGSIPYLQSGGLLPVSATPAGTNRDFFTIDADNSASSSIVLKFGETLAKTLTYSIANNRFEFNASVRIQGDLNVTGLINGVDVASLGASSDRYLKVTSGSALTVLVSSGSYRINGSMRPFAGTGSMSMRPSATNYLFLTGTGINLSTVGYPSDKSFLPLAEVITAAGSITRIVDKRVLMSDNREDVHEEILHPEFKNVAYTADGTNNVGQLSVSYDDSAMRNFYSWTSTKSSLQDYDIVVKHRLPSQFLRWTESLHVTYRSTSGSGAINALEVQVFDTAGAAVTLSGSTTGLASTSWTTQHIEFSGTPTWTAGQDITLKFKVSAKDNAQIHLGPVKLEYRKLNSQ
jgi:hypothetical protein